MRGRMESIIKNRARLSTKKRVDASGVRAAQEASQAQVAPDARAASYFTETENGKSGRPSELRRHTSSCGYCFHR